MEPNERKVTLNTSALCLTESSLSNFKKNYSLAIDNRPIRQLASSHIKKETKKTQQVKPPTRSIRSNHASIDQTRHNRFRFTCDMHKRNIRSRTRVALKLFSHFSNYLNLMFYGSFKTHHVQLGQFMTLKTR